jgi:putative ABC transport system permease protein
MKIPIVRGRDINDSDNDRTPGAIIIDQALQQKFFGAQDPLGVHVLINMGDGNPAREYEVVGIVADVKHMGLTDEPMPTLYGPIPQAPKSAVPFMANNLSLVVRTGIEPEALASTVRKELRNVDVDVATAGVRPMHQFLAASVAARRFNMELLAVFAVTALLLAAAGLYAVIAYLVSQRTREIGIRLALGATPRHILRLMMGQGMKLTLIGVTIGFAGAIVVTRLMRTLLFGVAPTDLMTFGIASVVLIVVALLACFIPARRATKVDPLVALRYE